MNKNKNIFLIVLVSLVILLIVPSISAEATNNEQQDSRKIIDVPEQSRIVDLGNGIMRYDHVHHDKFAKPPKPAKPDKAPGPSPFDYKLMGVEWWSAEDFQVNLGANKFGVDIIQDSLNVWELGTYGFFGDAEYSGGAMYSEIYDGSNTVTFESLENSGVIAFAHTWWYKKTGQIFESDVVFNSNYLWSISDEPVAMDLQNIATHEFGHSAGLLDLYHWKSSENTMYGYSDYGETKKRTLADGDIAGIHAIYGK